MDENASEFEVRRAANERDLLASPYPSQSSRAVTMRRLIELIKDSVAQCLYHSGLLRVILYARFRKCCVILMYHRVLPERRDIDSFSTESIMVTPDEFDWQMKLLHRYMRPSSLDSFYAFLEEKNVSIPSRSCLISFDDGWYDNLTYAWPILEKHRMPAVIFVCTSYIGTGKCLWQEKFSRILYNAWREPELGKLIFPLLAMTKLSDASATDIRRQIRKYVSELKNRPVSEIGSLLGQISTLSRSYGIEPDDTGDDRFMRWKDVAALSQSDLVDVGSHAVSHIPLTQLSNAEVFQEMIEARQTIESNTNHRVDILAYPNGDFDASVIANARKAGYRLAVTTEDGKIGRGDAPLSLRRISIHKTAARTPARFLCRLAGLL